MSEKIKLKMTVEIEFEADRKYYPENSTIDDIIKFETEAAKEGELIEVLISQQDFDVKIEQV